MGGRTNDTNKTKGSKPSKRKITTSIRGRRKNQGKKKPESITNENFMSEDWDDYLYNVGEWD